VLEPTEGIPRFVTETVNPSAVHSSCIACMSSEPALDRLATSVSACDSLSDPMCASIMASFNRRRELEKSKTSVIVSSETSRTSAIPRMTAVLEESKFDTVIPLIVISIFTSGLWVWDGALDGSVVGFSVGCAVGDKEGC